MRIYLLNFFRGKEKFVINFCLVFRDLQKALLIPALGEG